MTQVYKVQLSMNQRHLVDSGLTFKQGDFGFQIEIEVLDFDVTGVTPQIIFRKASGAVESTSITVSGNKFTYTMAGTELDTPGPAVCDLKLKNSTTQRISTASFRFFVEADTMNGLNGQASSYSDTIAQIVGGYEDELDGVESDVYDYQYLPMELGTIYSNGYYNQYGSFVSEAGRYYTIVTDFTANDSLEISTTIRSTLIPAVVYFNDNYFLSYEKLGSGSTEELTDYALTIPSNCNKIIVQNVDSSSIVVKKLTGVASFYKKNYIDNFLDTRTGKNLLDVTKSVDGYLNSSGEIVSSNEWKTSDFINVDGMDYLCCSWKSGTYTRELAPFFFVGLYDANKEFLSFAGSTVNSPMAIASTTKYIRFGYKTIREEIQVEQGIINTNYVPYKVYNVMPDSPYQETKESYNIRWCVLGDSLTERNSKANKQYYDYVSEALKCSVVIDGIGGTGYAKTNGANTNFVKRVLNLDEDNFDVITIFGSFNDYSAGLQIGTIDDDDTTTICGCINKTLENYFNTCPYTPIGLVTPTPWASVPISDTWANQYADAIVNIGKKWGVPVLDLFRLSEIRPWTGSDYLEKYYTENGVTDIGAHPNSEGHRRFLYPHFREFLKTLC